MAKTRPGPSLDFQAVRRVDAKTFKIIAHLTNYDSVAADAVEDTLAEGIAAATNGFGRLVPGSVRRRGALASAIVRANTRSQPMDASFTQVTAATAADASGKLWTVVDVDGAKRVVLESSDDLESIFASRVASRNVHANPAQGAGLSVSSFENGDLVRYVPPDAERASWGLAFRTEGAVGVVGADMIVRYIPMDLVVASVPRGRLPREIAGAVNPMEATARLSPEKLAKVVEYLRRSGNLNDAMQARLEQLAQAA
jgi:hypothetical protein